MEKHHLLYINLGIMNFWYLYLRLWVFLPFYGLSLNF